MKKKIIFCDISAFHFSLNVLRNFHIYKSIIKQDITGVYNISGEEYLSIFDFVCNIVKGFGFNESIINRCKSKEINQKAQRPKQSGLLIEKAKRDFDFSPNKLDVFLKSIK